MGTTLRSPLPDRLGNEGGNVGGQDVCRHCREATIVIDYGRSGHRWPTPRIERNLRFRDAQDLATRPLDVLNPGGKLLIADFDRHVAAGRAPP